MRLEGLLATSAPLQFLIQNIQKCGSLLLLCKPIKLLTTTHRYWVIFTRFIYNTPTRVLKVAFHQQGVKLLLRQLAP